ncbi:hypothetical protein ACFSSC_03500 [Corynebacterium mendelii]|uniref:Uncharacterized protein n=1 Tax=Corynebacterium mendelii TaxID=2765362 RepID=A0A939E0K8_9CORY|nr:hypothetical protein [Corynebacterium mendelii]MBN9643531.1 hypothetical protein [Corynebacterium mendelii]
MFGYTPHRIEPELEQLSFIPVTRTRQRAYIIANWAPTGGIVFAYLGLWCLCALSQLVLLAAVIWVAVLPGWSAFFTALMVIAGWHVFTLWWVVRSDESSPPYGSQTDGGFRALMWWVKIHPTWGINWWKIPRDEVTDGPSETNYFAEKKNPGA